MKVALPSSPFNRADLFEAAGFEVVEGRVRSTEDFIDLMKDADGAQVGVMPLTSREVMEGLPEAQGGEPTRCRGGFHRPRCRHRTRRAGLQRAGR